MQAVILTLSDSDTTIPAISCSKYSVLPSLSIENAEGGLGSGDLLNASPKRSIKCDDWSFSISSLKIMIGKTSLLTALLASSGFTKQEFSTDLGEIEPIDSFLAEDLTENQDEARRLADDWITGDSDDVRELQSKRFEATAAASSISSTTVAWPWPVPFYRFAYCRMRYNPAYPTTYPYGAFWLHEYGPWAPLRIRGYMRQMPGPNSWHGFLINRNRFDGQDCKSTEPTWNPWGQPQGTMNSWPSRAGDLRPIRDSSGNASWYGFAW